MKDSVSFKNSIVLGDYTENIDRIFRHDTLDILTKDSTIVIDLTKFEIILKQKREIEDDEN